MHFCYDELLSERWCHLSGDVLMQISPSTMCHSSLKQNSGLPTGSANENCLYTCVTLTCTACRRRCPGIRLETRDSITEWQSGPNWELCQSHIKRLDPGISDTLPGSAISENTATKAHSSCSSPHTFHTAGIHQLHSNYGTFIWHFYNDIT